MNPKNLKKISNISNRFEILSKRKYLAGLRADFHGKALRQPKPHPDAYLIEKMRMKHQVYDDIKGSIGSMPAESGGVLIGNPNSLVIECFVFDIMAATNRTVYQPNTKFLNSILKGRDNQFLGIVHSHTKGGRILSQQDRNAAWSNMTSPGNPHLNAYMMPLIQTIPDTGRFEIIPYIVTCHPGGMGRVIVKQVNLEIIE
jgi:proteasome lid subunit RPN8/RPN11